MVGRVAPAAVKHLWELEAGGRSAWVEQAMPTSWPLTWRVHSQSESDQAMQGGGVGARGQCRTRSLSARSAVPPMSRAASPTQAGRRWLGVYEAAKRYLLVGRLGGGYRWQWGRSWRGQGTHALDRPPGREASKPRLVKDKK